MFIDCRCPRCDKTVVGRQDVAIVKAKTAPKKYRTVDMCPCCKSKIALVHVPIGSKEFDLVSYYYGSV